MQQLEKLLETLKPRNDDSIVDRLNYLYTPILFFCFAMTTAAKQYVGKPVQCWPPAEFKDSWEKYVESLCFVENTYFVGMEERFPKSPKERETREIFYYQWVPFYLVAQMLLFIVPKLIWNTFNWKKGLRVKDLVQNARLTEKSEKKIQLRSEEKMAESSGLVAQTIVKNVVRRAYQNKQNAGFNDEVDFVKMKQRQNFLTFLYIAFKFLNFLNCFVQLFLLNRFLGPEYELWGFDMIRDLLHGLKWKESGHFPRVTFCDVEVRQPGSRGNLKFTLQCVLMINMFHEKIYIFAWLWLTILAFVNLLDFLYFSCISVIWKCSVHFAKSHLNLSKTKAGNKEIEAFVKKFLCRDGCTTLRLIEKNCGPFAVTEIINNLWTEFQGFLRKEISRSESAVTSSTKSSYNLQPFSGSPNVR